MDLSNLDWKAIVRTVAPAMATAVGTPAAGAIVAMLSNAIFGNGDATQEQLATVIQGGNLSPDQLAAITKADNDFKLEMQKLQNDLVRMDYADVADARARQIATKDHIPEIILGMAFAAYLAQMLLFYFGKMPVDEFTRALVVRAFGTIDGIVLTCVAYFVGSSRGSKTSGDSIRKIAEQSAK